MGQSTAGTGHVLDGAQALAAGLRAMSVLHEQAQAQHGFAIGVNIPGAGVAGYLVFE